LKTLDVKGKVFSGKGEGADFIKLSWVKAQIAEKLGFEPYSGTLNVKLTAKSVKLRKLLEKAKSIEISPADGFCSGRCFRACLMQNLECAVVVPESADYPENIIEIIAPIHLRKRLQLKDGSMVEVQIILE